MGKIKVAKIMLIISVPLMLFAGLFIILETRFFPDVPFDITLFGIEFNNEMYNKIMNTLAILYFVFGGLCLVPMILSFFIKSKAMGIVVAVLAIICGLGAGLTYPPIIAGILLLTVKTEDYYLL